MARVTLRGVEKSYDGGAVVVKGIDLEVADREFLVLVGPSGCGKSTTLRMIAGLEEISAGEILIGDRVVNRVAPRDRDIAMVFQNYALYPHMRVRDNMSFGLKLRGASRDEIASRVAEAARILDLGPLLDRYPKALSGGQRQRVAMGRAIVREPQVFLFDEPLSNLDAKLRGQMRIEIKKLHRAVDTTTIYVTHDQVEAMTLADRIVVMNAGVIEQVGTPRELYHAPATRFVADFLGSPPMNFLTARIEAEGDSALFARPTGGEAPRIALDAARHAGATAHVGRDVVLGIRPEHFRPAAADEAPGTLQVEVSVDIVEPLGSDTLVVFRLAGEDVCARLAATVEVEAGSVLRLALDPGQIHLFDAVTERVI